jgi:hypothetical protein
MDITPSLLEIPNEKCHNFKKLFEKLIKDLVKDINNINNPRAIMLYETNNHLINARNVLLSMYDCINCIENNLLNDKYIKCSDNIDEEIYDEITKSVFWETFRIKNKDDEINISDDNFFNKDDDLTEISVKSSYINSNKFSDNSRKTSSSSTSSSSTLSSSNSSSSSTQNSTIISSLSS